MFKSNILNIIISGVLTVLFFVAIIFFILGLQLLAAKISLLGIIGHILKALAGIFVLGIVWAGIYNMIRGRQDIKKYIDKKE